ncbi:hypothetical protein [Chamaesiphon sp. VAR_48_metabat_403]|uniref:hypothetical protein n=1 Tax=Chamaesiphon sp. VAR_48_metabat_403 TaxID=2964700 RepID=UPI00286EA57B|nr:hypothetical protein [Chamaesiphon sp. VAR_48_metabat_403]
MANILVKDLVRNSIAEADLFNDSENFIQDLSENELSLQGGFHLKKSLDILPTLEPGNFCLVLINNQLVEIFC